MATNYSYDHLPALQESQDIAEYVDTALRSSESDDLPTLRHPRSNSTLSGYTEVDQNPGADRRSLASFETYQSNSSTSSFSKIKSGLNRIRRKPLPRYLQGSIRRHPAAEIEPTRIARGVWKDQLLVDRSLRGMALLMSLFAIAMLIVVCTHAKRFGERPSSYTSSIGGSLKDCKDVTKTNTVLLLLINVAATMVLGMSNTYQQLVTSIKVGDLKHILEKFGDSRVGTNSPFNINHKSGGKWKSWAAWLLLILTSIPIHFLANSLIGPSYTLQPPTAVVYNESTWEYLSNSSLWGYSMSTQIINYASFSCWTAFRAGQAHLPESPVLLGLDSTEIIGDPYFGEVFSKITVTYAKENCSDLMNSTSDIKGLEAAGKWEDGYLQWSDPSKSCAMGDAIMCVVSESHPAQCRLNIRMNAAFILLGALTIKAIYMIGVNVNARGHLKRQLLTFGDVIVASASNPELRIQGECLVNARESYRRSNSHTCHKHCKNKVESKTGDEIGHCQKCKKWNSSNLFCNEPQPTIATKIKRTLISNLGNTALTQMCIMMFCSLVLIGSSLTVAVMLGMSYKGMKEDCSQLAPQEYAADDVCRKSASGRLEKLSGGWGGFNRSLPLTSLPHDELGNEMLAFLIANGAQFIYSLLYLLLIYNITIISQEYDWGKMEHEKKRIRCTTVKGESFEQDYLLQLPKKILFPVMTYSVLTHWMLGEALQTREALWMEDSPGRHVEHSEYMVTWAAYPLWLATVLILTMTTVCWWAFTYKREGFIPQMFGSMRVLCAATTQLDDFPSHGIKWGDLGMGKQFRHAGLSAEEVMDIKPYELYADSRKIEEESKMIEKTEEGRAQKDESDSGER